MAFSLRAHFHVSSTYMRFRMSGRIPDSLKVVHVQLRVLMSFERFFALRATEWFIIFVCSFVLFQNTIVSEFSVTS